MFQIFVTVLRFLYDFSYVIQIFAPFIYGSALFRKRKSSIFFIGVRYLCFDQSFLGHWIFQSLLEKYLTTIISPNHWLIACLQPKQIQMRAWLQKNILSKGLLNYIIALSAAKEKYNGRYTLNENTSCPRCHCTPSVVTSSVNPKSKGRWVSRSCGVICSERSGWLAVHFWGWKPSLCRVDIKLVYICCRWHNSLAPVRMSST